MLESARLYTVLKGNKGVILYLIAQSIYIKKAWREHQAFCSKSDNNVD